MEKFLQMANSLQMNELHRAVNDNNLEAVKFLVKSGVDIANTMYDGQTPIHIAIDRQYNDILEELFKGRPRKEVRNAIDRMSLKNGSTALHSAVMKNSLVSTRVLVTHGGCFEITDVNNYSPKQMTDDKNIKDLLDYLEEIFKSISLNDNNFVQKLNCCSNENLAVVAYARNLSDRTLLQQAMFLRNLDAIAIIIEFRIKRLKQKQLYGLAIEIKELVQFSKAMKLYSSNLDDTRRSINSDYVTEDVTGLLENSFKFLKACKQNIRDAGLDDQPLLTIIEESLEFFGPVTPNQFFAINERMDSLIRRRDIMTAMLKLCIIGPMTIFMQQLYTSKLLQAAQKNDTGLVEKCLTGYPDLNIRVVNKEWTALHYALDHSNNEMAKMLLNMGANPYVKTKNSSKKDTTLHVALRKKIQTSTYQKYSINSEIIQQLLESIDESNLADYINMPTACNGYTPLHLAVLRGNQEIVELLLSKGAIYCAKDMHDEVPECLAKYISTRDILSSIDKLFTQAQDGQAKEIVQIISGLSVNYDGNTRLAFVGARDDKGFTLSQILRSKGHVNEVEQIEKLVSNIKWKKRLW